MRVNYGWGLSRPSPERSSRDDEAPQDPLRVRKEVAEQIAKLEELHDELIGQLKEIQESQTDLWLQRWAGEQVAKAQMAKERETWQCCGQVLKEEPPLKMSSLSEKAPKSNS